MELFTPHWNRFRDLVFESWKTKFDKVARLCVTTARKCSRLTVFENIYIVHQGRSKLPKNSWKMVKYVPTRGKKKSQTRSVVSFFVGSWRKTLPKFVPQLSKTKRKSPKTKTCGCRWNQLVIIWDRPPNPRSFPIPKIAWWSSFFKRYRSRSPHCVEDCSWVILFCKQVNY